MLVFVRKTLGAALVDLVLDAVDADPVDLVIEALIYDVLVF